MTTQNHSCPNVSAPEANVPDHVVFLRDEDAPAKIEDPDAVKPDGWLDEESDFIPDPNAEKPEDWWADGPPWSSQSGSVRGPGLSC